MKRAFWLVPESLGMDQSALGLGTLASWFELEQGRLLSLPTLAAMGLGELHRDQNGSLPAGWMPRVVSGTTGFMNVKVEGGISLELWWRALGYGGEEKRVWKGLADLGNLGEKVKYSPKMTWEEAREDWSRKRGEVLIWSPRFSEICVMGQAGDEEEVRQMVVKLRTEAAGVKISRFSVFLQDESEENGRPRLLADYHKRIPGDGLVEHLAVAGLRCHPLGRAEGILSRSGVGTGRPPNCAQIWRELGELSRQSGESFLAVAGFPVTEVVEDRRFHWGRSWEDWDRELAAFLELMGPEDLVIVTPFPQGGEGLQDVEVPLLMRGGPRRELEGDVGPEVIAQEVLQWLKEDC